MSATHIQTDVNYQDGSIVNWFVVSRKESEADSVSEVQTFGIVDRAGQKSVVYSDGEPLRNDYLAAIVLRECEQVSTQ
jgi:hypothetical protein